MEMDQRQGSEMRGMGVRILGTGSYLPSQIMSNFDFEKTLDTTDQWITTRTGISERRIAAANESSATLGFEASKKALTNAGLKAKDLDLIICASITPEMIFPSTACFIQAGLGCRPIAAFDVLAACSGFIYALTTGAQFIAAGTYKNVLVVGSETLSRVTDYKDRSTAILFGDGAGAAVLTSCPTKQSNILFSRLYADGSRPDLLSLPGGGSRHPASRESLELGLHYMKIQGQEVFKFAVNCMRSLIEEALTKCELSINDITLIVPHQVNQRVIDSAISYLNIPAEKVMVNIGRYGNTSAASIPIALDEALREGRAKKGDRILLVAFGGGLTWSSMLLTL